MTIEQPPSEALAKKSQLTSADKERTAEVADALEKAFLWIDSPQGHEYWRKVYRELQELAGEYA